MIRRLNSQDAESYFALRLAALQESPEAFASTYEEEKDQRAEKYKPRFQTEDSFTFGAFDGEELVGIITLVREKLMKLSHRTTILAMYVAPEKRGLGIAKALVQKAIDQAEEWQGIEQVYLTVVTTNEAAIQLYASLGFEVFATEKRALKSGDTYYDEYLMVRFLA